MKKLLLGSTALVAFGLMAAPASAQVELTITGNVDAQFGWGDDDFDDDQRDYGGTTDTTLNVNAEGVADNGLRYGARINIDDGVTDGNSSFLIDETWVFVAGDWGQVRLGEKEGQASNLRFAVPSVGNGQADGDFGRYINDFGIFGTDFIDSGDDAKVSYIGEFGAFTFGASYSPTTGQQLSNPGLPDNDPGQFEDIFSVGANYNGDWDTFKFGVSGGFVTGSAEADEEDLTEYGVGGQVGFGPFLVGGFWINSDGGAVDDRDRFGLGATFSAGPWSFGLNALWASSDDQDDQVYGAGLAFDIAPGLQAYADFVLFEYDVDAGADNDGTVILTGLTASF
jgi:predicted porin